MNIHTRPIFSSLGACAAALLFSFSSLRAAEATATSAPTAASATEKSTGIPTIFVCGDSTAKNDGKTRANPPVQMRGWGTSIVDYFDSSKVKINNVGHAGTSSRTYYEGDWPKVVPQIKAGDYVLIVFGINDGGLRTPNGLGDEVNDQGWHTYGWYMSKMATDALAKDAHVYLLTVTARDIWTNPKATFTDAVIKTKEEGYNPADDRVDHKNWGSYPQWTKDVGAKLHLPVLDLTNLEADRYDKMGREKVMVNYTDHNHTTVEGADIVANIIVSGLKAFKNSPFTAMLSAKGKALPTADAKYVIENPATDKPAATKVDTAKPATAAASAK